MKVRKMLIKFAAVACLIGLVGSTSAQVPVGTPLPDLTVYDASGKTFNLTELRGSYSVLVFGCLT